MRSWIAFPLAFAAVALAWSQTSGRHRNRSRNQDDGSSPASLNGVWELVSGQPLPPGVRDVKVISAGHFMFAAYDTQNGRPLYTAGGTYTLEGSSYTERIDFASDVIANGLIGQNQQFTIELHGDSLKQAGTLSNGKALAEVWKRVG